MAYIDVLRASRDRAFEASNDPWRIRLEKLKGRVWEDQIERIASQAIFDHLDVAPRMRTAQACRRLAKIMTELGWTPIRARGLNHSGYRDQVRGWARDRSDESKL